MNFLPQASPTPKRNLCTPSSQQHVQVRPIYEFKFGKDLLENWPEVKVFQGE